MGGIGRKQFLLSAGALLAAPLIQGQQARKSFRIGFPTTQAPSVFEHLTAAFELGLRDLGHNVGQDVVLDIRSAGGKPERFPEVARDVVESNPDLILSTTTGSTARIRALTSTIPIVMLLGTNVVREGLVQSLASPGGNITGLTWDVGEELAAKRFELMKLAVPNLTRMGVLTDPPFDIEYRSVDQDAAGALGIELVRMDISDAFDASFVALRDARVDAVISYAGTRQFARRAELAALALKYRLPTGLSAEEFVLAGGLLSYGPNLSDLYRRGAGYASRILKGAKPADLPIQRPTLLDLVINLQTARMLGLKLPPTLLIRAQRVIE